MDPKQRIKSLKNEDGAALVLAMMVLVVLSVLGAGLGMLTVGSYRLSDNSREYNSAYYIAEAGANMAYEEIENEVNKIYKDSTIPGDFFNSIKNLSIIKDGREYNNFDLQSGNQPIASITVIEESSIAKSNEPKEYIIKSIGKISGKERIVEKPFTVTWQERNANGILPDVSGNTSLIIKDRIKYMGGTIKGEVYLDSKEEKSFEVANQFLPSPARIFTSYPNSKADIYKSHGPSGGGTIEKLLPNTSPMSLNLNWTLYDSYIEKLVGEAVKYETYTGDFASNSEKTISIDQNYKKDKILLQGLVTLDVSENHVILFTDELQVEWGNTKVLGEGSLTIIVSDKVTFHGPLNDNRGNLRLVFPNSNTDITITNGSNITAQIIAPYSEVKFGNNLFTGNIIAKSFNKLNSGGTLQPVNLNFEKSDANAGSLEEVSERKIISAEPSIESNN